MPALAAIEAVPTDSKDKPREEIVLVKATVFTNPIAEMEDALEQELQVKIDAREVSYSAVGGGGTPWYCCPRVLFASSLSLSLGNEFMGD